MIDAVAVEQFARAKTAELFLRLGPLDENDHQVHEPPISAGATNLFVPASPQIGSARSPTPSFMVSMTCHSATSTSTNTVVTATTSSVADVSNYPQPGNESPFEALDPHTTAEREIEGRIIAFRLFSLLKFRKDLADRIDALMTAWQEEEGEAITPDMAASLSNLLLFLETTPRLREPDIVLNPEGHFRAQWRKDRDAHFAVDFRPNGSVIFVVFSRDPKHPNEIRRLSGTAFWDSLMATVEPYGVASWAFR